jgi:hypothetical protein
MNTYVGVDLGQNVDYAAITIVTRTLALNPATGWPVRDSFGWPRWAWRIRGLYRLPLRTSYEHIAEFVAIVASWSALQDPITVVDSTGVGVAAIETIRGAASRRSPDARIWGVSITSGEGWRLSGRMQLNAGKVQIIGALRSALEGGRLRICRLGRHDGATPKQTDLLINELRAFTQKPTDAGNRTMGAASGRHDDAVLSLALAVWFSSQQFQRADDDDPAFRGWERQAIDLERSGISKPLANYKPSADQAGSTEFDSLFGSAKAKPEIDLWSPFGWH